MKQNYSIVKILFCSIFAYIIFALSCTPPHYNPVLKNYGIDLLGAIDGQIIDESNRPVKGAKIGIEFISGDSAIQIDKIVKSRSDGKFRIEGIPAKIILLTINPQNDNLLPSTNIIFSSASDRQITFSLISSNTKYETIKGTAAIIGRMIEYEYNEAIPGAWISLDGKKIGSANTSGFYELSGIQPGIYKMTAECAGFFPLATDKISIEANSILNINFYPAVSAVFIGKPN
jgi:hypothetical protein